jgi:serine/threonine-protein kinase
MVCGRKPFIEDEHKSVMHKIRLERYPAPRKLNPLVPWELERILARCMRKRREERYRSTQDLVVALERFIARRCDMNYHARLVVHLRDLGVISEEEADSHLHPAVAGRVARRAVGQPVAGLRLGRLVALQGAVLAAMALATSFIHLAPVGAQSSSLPQLAAASRQPGQLKVIVDPWAEVYVDGRMIDVTPMARAALVPEGRHRLELRNPYFEPVTRELIVQRGSAQTVKVALTVRKR